MHQFFVDPMQMPHLFHQFLHLDVQLAEFLSLSY